VSGAAAAGYWPAFWMLGAAARPVGRPTGPASARSTSSRTSRPRSEFGDPPLWNHPGGECNRPPGSAAGAGLWRMPDGYHTYAMELDRSVSPEQIRWYLDGAQFLLVNAQPGVRVD